MLNALRHQRFGTQRCGSCRRLAPRAQRLTASEVWHLAGFRVPGEMQNALHPPVLNALRHQRFGTIPDASTSRRSLSAQRLTASEVWHTLT